MSTDSSQLTTATGLTTAQVAERVHDGQVNACEDGASRSIGQILRGNIFTLFNAILGAALVVVLAVGDWRDAVFGLVLVFNAGIGIAGEYRAKRTLDKLAILNEPHATVIRDGAEQQIETEQIVLDDVMLLSAGDQVAADAVVLDAVGLDVDESLLTGESEPVDKDPGDTVLSGSIVVAGSATTRVVKVGAEGYANRLTAEARRFSLARSELRAGINTVLKVVAWVIVPIAILLCYSQLQAHGGLADSIADGSWRLAVVDAVAGVVGMVPEGLVLLTSINFALAAVILARRMVLVQELPAVEILARVDVVCLDKTGTITDGSVSLDSIRMLTESVGARPALAAMAADRQANATVAAIGQGLADVVPDAIVEQIPFSSARKWSAIQTTDSWYLGAPEVLLAGRDDQDAQDALSAVSQAADDGARVVLLAVSSAALPVVEPSLPADLIPAAVVVLREQVRPDAAQTLAYFRDQGVELKVISGDNPATVAAIAQKVQVAGERQVSGFDARQLPTDPEELAEAVSSHTVFGRVTPEQKRAMVHALQSRGRTVAMTGDGVNDALALKDADLGIAMGSGAPATKAVARLVLMDGKFSSLPGVVAEGRRVIANMERVANLFLTKTTYAALIAVIVVIAGWQYPFLPRQLTIIGSLTIGIPGFLIALAPNKRRYLPGFLRRVLMFAIPCGVVAALASLVAYRVVGANGDEIHASTAATLTLICVGLWVLGALARPLNWWRVLLVIAMAAAALGAVWVPFIRHFFELSWPTPQMAVVIAICAVAGCAAVEVIYRVTRRHVRA